MKAAEIKRAIEQGMDVFIDVGEPNAPNLIQGTCSVYKYVRTIPETQELSVHRQDDILVWSAPTIPPTGGPYV